jgi:hypothetical protein
LEWIAERSSAAVRSEREAMVNRLEGIARNMRYVRQDALLMVLRPFAFHRSNGECERWLGHHGDHILGVSGACVSCRMSCTTRQSVLFS